MGVIFFYASVVSIVGSDPHLPHRYEIQNRVDLLHTEEGSETLFRHSVYMYLQGNWDRSRLNVLMVT